MSNIHIPDGQFDFSAIENSLNGLNALKKQIESSMQPSGSLHIALENAAKATSLMPKPEHIIEGLTTAANVFEQIRDRFNYDAMLSAMQNLQAVIDSVIQNIHVPEISEERKKYLIQAHREWGQLGWTIIPTVKAEKLYDLLPPQRRAEADKLALGYCRDTEQLFKSLRESCGVRKRDLEEAIADFNGKRYKSCAMLLFSLIDGKLIRFQGRANPSAKSRRKVGKGAAESLQKQIETASPQKGLFAAMFDANLFACLATVFADGKDFKTQPEVINRNFLDHGMMTGKVTKKSCLQLFLLYYNTLELLEMIHK